MYVIGSHLIPSVAVCILGFFNVNCKWQLAVGHRPPPIGHSRLLAVMNNPPGLNYGPKKSDWLNSPLPPEILVVETAMAKNLVGRNLDYRLTIIQHSNRDFDVSYKKCFFDPVDIQSINQSIKQANNFSLQDSSLREREYNNVPIACINSCWIVPRS